MNKRKDIYLESNNRKKEYENIKTDIYCFRWH